MQFNNCQFGNCAVMLNNVQYSFTTLYLCIINNNDALFRFIINYLHVCNVTTKCIYYKELKHYNKFDNPKYCTYINVISNHENFILFGESLRYIWIKACTEPHCNIM